MKTVITYGVFDIFHIGHYNLLKRAKELGDRLIVGVCSDEFAQARGKAALVDTLAVRVGNVRSTGLADMIITEEYYGQKLTDVQRYKADIFVIGDDWTGQFDYLKDYCQVIYLPRTPGISTTALRNAPPVRFGIIGTGRQAERFAANIISARRYAELASVYNPNAESCLRYANRHSSQACDSTERLFETCDAIYIASPHGTHFEYARQALERGRHVLCEKPMAFSARQAEELFSIAEKKGLVLMEALKTAYCPGFMNLTAMVKRGIIGDVVDIDSTFTRLTGRDKREWTDTAFGGSFLEFGSYTLLPVVKFLGTDDVSYTFLSVNDEKGLDSFTRFIATNGKQSASGKNGIGAKSEGQLIISGTEGYILVKAPWWKTAEFEIRREDPEVIEIFKTDFESEGIGYELYDFFNQVNGNTISRQKLTRKESVAIAGVFEQFLKENRQNKQ